MTIKNKKRSSFYGELSGLKGKVRFLQPYYYQSGKWHKLKTDRRTRLYEVVFKFLVYC